MDVDPRITIRNATMSRAQVFAVAITGILSVLDGYDLLSITFVAPVLAREFQAGSGALGLLLSSGLVGTLIGSFGLAALGDFVGRRPVVLISLVIMGLGMLAACFCHSIVSLAVVRAATGVGIGSMVVVVNPIAVEVSNDRTQAFALAMMSIGYPIGGMTAGAVTAVLLAGFGWRSVFLVGFFLAVLVAPIVILHLPESMSFLLEKRPAGAVERVNKVLRLYGHLPLAALPPADTKPVTSYAGLFRASQRAATMTVAAISLLMFLTIYFFLSWQPKMLVDIGFSPTSAAKIAGASSFAGAIGCALFGVLSRRIPGRRLAQVSIFLLGATVICFGFTPSVMPVIIAIAMAAGLSVAASTVGLHVIIAEAFPPAFRSTGAGFAIGIGRIGSALGPAVAGGLFGAGLGRAEVAGLLGVSAIAAFVILTLRQSRSAADRTVEPVMSHG